MKRIIIGLLLVVLYSFPYVFFAMYQDFNGNFMLGYGLMVIMSLIMGICAFYSKWYVVLLIGNVLTFIVSYYFNMSMVEVDNWSSFFKPLTPTSCLILISFFNLIPQFIGVAIRMFIMKRTIG